MAYRTGIVLQLGAIATSVNIESAVEREESLKTLCLGPVGGTPHDPTPIKNNPACPTCSNDDFASFHKGRNVGTTRAPEYQVAEVTEIASVRENTVGATKDIIQLSVHKAEDVATQTIQGESVYYLTPSKPGLMPLYSMLVDVLRRHPELVFMGQWTAVSRPTVYQIKLFGDTLVMESRHRTESLKIAQQAVVGLDANQQGMVDTIVASLVTPFDPATYADTYRAGLDALMASKSAVAGTAIDPKKAAASSVPTGTVDLTALLSAQLGA